MKKLLVISTAVAMLSLSGAAYAGHTTNSSTQVQVATLFSSQANGQVGIKNSSTQVQKFSAFSSQLNAQGGVSNASTQVQIGAFGSSQTSIQVSP